MVLIPGYCPSTVILSDTPATAIPLASFKYPLTVTLPDEYVYCVIVMVVAVRVEVVAFVELVVRLVVELVLAVTVTVPVLVVYSIIVRMPSTVSVIVDQMVEVVQLVVVV